MAGPPVTLPAMPELLIIKAAECLPLRERILRPGQAASAYTYAQDNDPRAMHFGLRQGKALIGVASLLPELRSASSYSPGPEQWRLRGMAVESDRRGKGLGRMLLQAVQAVTQQRGGGLWMTARVGVRAFYERFGCKVEGESFDLPGAGPHVLMTWHPIGTVRMKFGPAGTFAGTGEDDEEDVPKGAKAKGLVESPADGGEDEESDAEPDLDRDPGLPER